MAGVRRLRANSLALQTGIPQALCSHPLCLASQKTPEPHHPATLEARPVTVATLNTLLSFEVLRQPVPNKYDII